jgi:beta-glucosidase
LIEISSDAYVKRLCKPLPTQPGITFLKLPLKERPGRTLMKNLALMSVLTIMSTILAQTATAQTPNTFEDSQVKIKQLVSQLTLEEKASLLSGRDDWSTQSIDRLAIPWIWLADGPHGLRRAPQTNKPGYGDQLPATAFPTASALAASWDLDMIYEVGRSLGKESQALDVNVLLGPGVQGVGTSLKHYAANNVETKRMYMNSALDDRTLHEIYLTPFEISVKKAQPWTIMASYNRIQGVYGTQNPYLLTDVLKKQWGFEGIVISDWFAIVDRVAAVKAGMHIEMPGLNAVNDNLIIDAVKSGELDEALVDGMVADILTMVFRAKALEKQAVELDVDKHHALARHVAAESITLLKNQDKVLPVSPQKYRNVAIIGEFAVNPRFQGNGSSEVKPTRLDQFLELVNREYGDQFQFHYSQGYQLSDDNDFSLIDAAKKVAASADIALVFAGLPLHYESEGIDRTHIDMPASHNRLISEIAKVQENTVTVLTNGSAITMPWADQVSGILETWLAGQAGAGGSADVIFGKANPSGKLAETFPVKLEDTPAFFNFPGEQGEVLYGEQIFVGYRYYDKKKIEPLFPFGFGLSYTDFEYSKLELSAENITDKTGLEVSVNVRNSGDVFGKEVIQLYLTDTQSSLQRPPKELKRFKKIALKPGEEKTVTFKLESRDFSYYDAVRKMWIAESGEFVISAASSSRDIRLSKPVTLQSTQKVHLAFDEYTFFSDFWKYQQTRELLKQSVPEWIKSHTPEGKTADDAEFQDFMVEHPLIKYPYITNGEITPAQVLELVRRSRGITYTP